MYKYKRKTMYLNHYTIENGAYLIDVLSYSIRTNSISIYLFMRYDRENVGFTHKKGRGKGRKTKAR